MDRQEVSCWLHPIRFSDVRVGDVHAGQNDGDADSLHQGKGLAQQGDAGGDGYDGGNADERRRAVYADAGDGYVGQEEGQDGTADALIQDGSEEGWSWSREGTGYRPASPYAILRREPRE